MTRPPFPEVMVKPLLRILLLSFVAIGLVACSGDEPSEEDATTMPSVQPSTGDECTDPVGDLTSDARSTGVGTEPAGVDLTQASARVQGDELAVQFTTAGEITTAPGTTFAIAQGTPFTTYAFELRMTAGEGGVWDIEVITWDTEERKTSVPLRPTVAGNTLRADIPMSALQPLALYLQFGASGELEGVGRVVDDCSSLSTAPTIG
jgi:hypothetical protein